MAISFLVEPTIGLHSGNKQEAPKDSEESRNPETLLGWLEHIEEVIRSSDYIVDVGPGAGVHGGDSLLGTTQALLGNPAPVRSSTGKYLNGKAFPFPDSKCPLTPTENVTCHQTLQKTISRASMFHSR